MASSRLAKFSFLAGMLTVIGQAATRVRYGFSTDAEGLRTTLPAQVGTVARDYRNKAVAVRQVDHLCVTGRNQDACPVAALSSPPFLTENARGIHRSSR